MGRLAMMVLLAGCGARTGLEIETERVEAGVADAGMDAEIADAGDAGDAAIGTCTDQRITLAPLPTEVMFVLDRSTSMGWALEGPGGSGPIRWTLLVDSLRAQLPRYDERHDMGMILYPDFSGASCGVSPDPQVEPGPMNASRMLAIVEGTGPTGTTPTADALDAALRWFRTHPAEDRARFVVLATDGAPNCNAMLDGFTCPCTSATGTGCASTPALCLDDERTIDVVERLFDAGVPTFVIGIDGDPDALLTDVLSRVAIAGGRPNPLDPGRGFYSVHRAEDLGAAFESIQASISWCSLVLDVPVLDGREVVEVWMEGERVPRDPSHIEGWDWHDASEDAIELHGDVCRRAQGGVLELELRALCPP